MRLICLAGTAGSGKDTVGHYLGKHYFFQPIALAEPMKMMLMAMLVDVISDEELQESLFGSSDLRNRQIAQLTLTDGSPLTYRHALQTLGTEWGRDCIFADLWVLLGIQKAMNYHRAVITDGRFPNEWRQIKISDGQVWHIERPGAGLSGAAANHASEIHLTNGDIERYRTHHIINDGTLDELFLQVDLLMEGIDVY